MSDSFFYKAIEKPNEKLIFGRDYVIFSIGVLKMKQTLAICIFVMTLVLAVYADVPRTMNYQGKLTDPGGVAVSGPVSITFRIYDSETGGALLWSETYASVAVSNGLFDVILGGGTAMTLPFDEPYWIELEIDGEVLAPREEFAAVSYAHRAVYADTAEFAVGGGSLPSGTENQTIRRNASDWEATNDLVITSAGNVGIGTTGPNSSAALDVSSTSRGFLPPRMTEAQRDAIPSPSAGLSIYNTTTNCLNFYIGTEWMQVCGESTSSSGSETFFYTGSVQNWTVPTGVTSITIEAWGAQGGGAFGGNGGQAVATIPVTPGQLLHVYVGGTPTGQLGAGGYNGGGAIGALPCGGGSDGWPGGGASDVRVSTYALANRIIVAGGGGGQGWSNGVGGSGGGASGDDGAASWISGTNGKGGTQFAGGAGGGPYEGASAPNGSLGTGGDGAPISGYCIGGGGGGGYYGGGGGYVSAGGGGSSYISYPGSTSTSTTAGVRSGNGQVIISW